MEWIAWWPVGAFIIHNMQSSNHPTVDWKPCKTGAGDIMTFVRFRDVEKLIISRTDLQKTY